MRLRNVAVMQCFSAEFKRRRLAEMVLLHISRSQACRKEKDSQADCLRRPAGDLSFEKSYFKLSAVDA